MCTTQRQVYMHRHRHIHIYMYKRVHRGESNLGAVAGAFLPAFTASGDRFPVTAFSARVHVVCSFEEPLFDESVARCEASLGVDRGTECARDGTCDTLSKSSSSSSSSDVSHLRGSARRADADRLALSMCLLRLCCLGVSPVVAPGACCWLPPLL